MQAGCNACAGYVLFGAPIFCVLFIESPAYSVLFTSSLLSCSSQDEYADTPLIAASVENHIEVARFLLEHGASINYQTKVFL